uniref:Synaptonemal complex protein 1 n=1 Tax=Stegastes partitus TaxID=144197 RepID=A0A3B4ZN17_9TELE
MERDRGFNFKLLVPRRANSGEISAVRPQGRVESFGDFINTMEESHTKFHDKEPNMPFPKASVIAPTKPTRQVYFLSLWLFPQNNYNPGQLYSKLFDEVDKIKYWKVKVDSEAIQKERRLQDSRKTIENQRKAIQELQFGNESLSIKLEEQISENDDLRNKNNTTRNLCNILKDTFQWSAEKMHLFESEREETHHLFMENSENVKRLTAAFESLRIRVEADQQEMQKVKEGLLQFENLKEKYQQEYKMKDEEVVMLKAKLDETQKHCVQLQEATNQQCEVLRNSKTEQYSLLQKLHAAEQGCKETEIKVQELEGQLFSEMQGKKECTFQMEQLRRDIMQHELQEESQNLKRLKKDEHQKVLKDVESKSNLIAELENEIQKLGSTAAEAIKNKEDTELKCQQKIADMVALMEKHKSQYDRMLDEKDAELDKKKTKEMEAVAQVKSLLDLSKHITENDQLKKLLKTETTEKVWPSLNLVFGFVLKQVVCYRLRNSLFGLPFNQFYLTENTFLFFQSTVPNYKQGRCSETLEESSSKTYTFDFSKTRKTPSSRKDDEIFPSYRVRTPPSATKAAQWRKSTFELDLKSDSSDQSDMLTFADAPTFVCFSQLQTPATHKSPGTSLKLAAMKRMRDAGWSAVIGCDKKRKKAIDKVFA